MHPEQNRWCVKVRRKFPTKFVNVDVLDIGSMDINGNNRWLFKSSKYTGIDIGPGKNVDFISPGHEYSPGKQFDVVISTECLEHDKHWRSTIMNAIALTKPSGIILITCATTGRQEHGTTATTPKDSPFTNDYYHNLTQSEIEQAIHLPNYLSEWKFDVNNKTKDLYFYGIKK